MVRKLKKDVRELVEWVEDHGWTVEEPSGGGYLKAKCACGLHILRIPFTPSGARTLFNLRKHFQRQACWQEDNDAGT